MPPRCGDNLFIVIIANITDLFFKLFCVGGSIVCVGRLCFVYSLFKALHIQEMRLLDTQLHIIRGTAENTRARVYCIIDANRRAGEC